MSQFKEYKNLNLIDIADNVAEFWKQNKTFSKSVEIREGQPEFVFYEGPPSANGMPGIHHVMARALKDIFCRYQTQNGKQVFRKAGWDTHGLPVELGVEKELGITKEDIGKKISIEDYNKACREAVMRYTDVWNNLTEKIGYWVDLDDPYITYKSKYMETVWWLLKQLYDKELLYKGYTIQPYSPKAGTGLSSHELNQPGTYRDVSDTTVVAQFKVKKESSELFRDVEGDVSILAWTTTPWTLPSNTALTVGRDIEYVLVKTFNQYTFEPVTVVLAGVLLPKVFGKKYAEGTDEDFASYTAESKTIPFKILKEFTGEKLVDTRYEQLVPWFTPNDHPENAFRVILGDFVTTEDGTGIVHTAPTFGADDARVAKMAQPEIPPMLVEDENDNLVPLVDLQGKFIKGEHVPELFAGKYIKNEYYDEGTAPEKSWDVELAILLKTENKAFKVEKYVHSYPHCWRTDKPVLYYPLDSWFVKMTAVKERLVNLNKEINWKPKATGEGRFANWLENVNDWNLSRSRYWGIPLPIWRTDDLKEEKIIGSVEELYNEIEKSVAAGLMAENPFKGFVIGNMSEQNYALVDLHKNVVDKVVLVSDSGKTMKRESDLIDVWFDSGSMPYAQLHYPFENKELIDSHKAFPADFIAEGVDQTRGWFYTLHAIGTAVFDSVAYKNVMSNGLVLDKNGQKMSKRLGNAVDPFETLAVYGPDATRWYMISNANPWENLKFDIEGIDEVRRKFFGTLYNTYSFLALYANVDGFTYAEKDVENRPEIDRWILSELNLLIKEVKSFYEDYEPTRVARAISTFVNDNLSNWYVRLCRRRFWKGEYSEDKISAYQTLYTCLEVIAKLSAPIAPFFMDQLYQDLNAVTGKEQYESVHLTDFPVADESLIDQDLVEKTHLAQNITSMVFSLRKKENVKVRQPLQKVLIPVLDAKAEAQILAVADLIKQEVNVKELQLINAEEASHLIVKQIKPNFKALGPKLGKDMKTVGGAIAGFAAEQITELEKKGSIDVQGYEITLDDVEISTKDIPGWTVTSDGKTTVALDLKLTDELKSEGIAREFINRIQNLRKDKDFELTDRIIISIEENTPFLNDIMKNKEYISSEVLSDEIKTAPSLENFNEIEIDEVSFKINIQKN
ncbi:MULTISPECIES: isoleucine--tRNA ligase [Chryseobacterium]|uniref:Isoleucine--tRNA ligase n=1 Tax=Chryseobacterium camelliae TaxID=1265445 RepID=A0ABU0TLL7_9FLAO|nr:MULTISPECIES: isoleucine--tRNA ligase [Chryseobacterium]MDT3408203.1 isoleucyl-tRNA synthetase [Pseudacidovorax intermedius]MDQ1097943.1 isoleucyl-tRNA synthetase [Chryseobacterium camelliae]MDQ1101874.1 isoleucyl-tRNA synthetase [Chryseobacterium sp. SORGH_AS_1048]MDR6085314.1 isoleucyl-tRNA synthetase [Chryseobacterium sp. SORGH_AS_0909]MDR6129671.1 isoleucyl-tRNA synthetase [Chryseobacterium sp. SORGH_AS_1175]